MDETSRHERESVCAHCAGARRQFRLSSGILSQHQILHLLCPALDLLLIAGEGDVLDQRSPLKGDGGALHLQVLDARDRVTVTERRAVAVFNVRDLFPASVHPAY